MIKIVIAPVKIKKIITIGKIVYTGIRNSWKAKYEPTIAAIMIRVNKVKYDFQGKSIYFILSMSLIATC